MVEAFTLPARNLVKAEGLSADASACVEFLAIGAHAVRRGGPSKGESVLVVGAGPIGLGTALFARLNGADVYIFDIDTERASQVADITNVKVLASTDPDDAGWLEGGFDMVFDVTGNQGSMEKAFNFVASGGTYVMVGVVKDPITFMDADFHRKEMTLRGSRNATSEDFERVISAIRNADVDAERIITHRTSLACAASDLGRWATEKAGLIKAVIEIS